MKNLFVFLLLVCVPFSIAHAREIAVTMNKVSTSGIGDSIGVVVVTESKTGLVVKPYLHGMSSGDYMFSINETMSCHSLVTSAGLPIPAMAAGNSVWQLPDLRVSAGGSAMTPVRIDNIGFNDISHRTLVISKRTGSGLGFSFGHERIACGSLEQY